MPTQLQPWLEEVRAFAGTTTGVAVLAALVLLGTLAWCRVFAKAGFHGATGVLMWIPVVNLVLFGWLAFGPWPARREARQLRKMQRRVQRADRQVRDAA